MNTNFESDRQTGKDEWLTPPNILEALGVFDLDPCSQILMNCGIEGRYVQLK